MTYFKKISLGLFSAFALAALSMGPAKAVPVALELALAVDNSGSIDATEYTTQVQGYVDAFKSAAIHSAIADVVASTGKGIAVTYVSWSGATQQSQDVGWTEITNAAQSIAFGDAIAAAVLPSAGGTRPFSGSTAIGEALSFTSGLFGANGFEGDRLVIDVSGDGATNDGITSAAGRAIALGAVDRINGLVVNDPGGVLAHYNSDVIGGGGFALNAPTFGDFASAVETKIRAEILDENPIPEPATLALFGLGVVGVGLMRRRRAA